MPSIQTATTLKCAYNMIEDYVQTMLPPVAQSVADCFIAVQNDREDQLITELMTVSNQNNLLRFYPDGASNSGWNHEEILVDGAPAGDIQKIVSFYQNGVLYALAHYNAGGGNNAVIGMQRTVDTDWGLMPFDPDLRNALGQMRQTDSFGDAHGVQFFYGVTEGFQPAAFVLVGQDPQSGSWVPLYLEPVASATATYRILPGFDGNQMTVVTVDGSSATFRGGSIVNGHLVWDGKAPVTHDLGQGPITAAQVFAVPSASGDQGFLLQGENSQLFHVAGYETPQITVTPLTGGTSQPPGVITVSVGQAQQNLYMVFAIDNIDQRLWLLRQTPSDGGPVAFDPWVPLGNNLGALSCPADMGTGPELFYYDLTANVGHMCQQVEQGNWFTQTVATPSPETEQPTHTSTYSTEFTTADSTGNAVPRSVARLTADRPSVAIINGISYHIDSKTPATVVSDSYGRLTLATQSTGLLSPQLTVTSETLGTQGPFRSDLRVHQRLSGQDPTFPVTGASMKAAGLIDPSVSSSDADSLASKTRSLGTAAVSMHSGAGTGVSTAAFRALHGTGWEIDFRKTKGMVRDLAPEEVAALRTNALTLSLGDIWGDICNFFRHLIDDLEKLVISFADDVVYVAVTLAEGVKHFILKTLAEVADCIEIFLKAVASIVKKIEDAIEKAIQWLRMLFDWEDVIRTKQVVSYYIDQSLKNLAYDFTTTIPKDLIAAFTKVKDDVVNAFNELEQVFEAGVSFNQFGPKSSSDPVTQGGPPYEGVGGRLAYQTNAVQCNYVQSKMNSSASSILPHLAKATAQAGSFDPEQILKIFEETFPTEQLEQSWEKIKSFSSQIHDAKSFLDVAVLDLLEVIKDMVLLILSGIEAVLLALSEVMGLALTGLDTLLATVIDIPIISQIYKLIAKKDLNLTILDLMSLLIALPATILYKLIYGGPNLNPPFTEAEVEQILSNPMPWPTWGSSKPRDTRPLPEAIPADVALAFMFLFSAMPYAAMDVVLDDGAAEDAGGGETAEGADALDPMVMAGIASIVATVAMQGFGVPYAAMKRIDENQGTSADVWAIVAWCTAWLPPLSDTVFAIGSKDKKVTRFQATVGPFLSLAEGIVMIGCGAKAVHEMLQDTVNYNKSNQTAMLLPTFPYIFQPLVLLGTDTPPALAAQVALWLVDLASDVGTGVAVVVASSGSMEEATHAAS